jgi:hypothetical protein
VKLMRVGKGTFFVLDKLHVGVSAWDVILDNNTPSCDLHACFLYYMVLKPGLRSTDVPFLTIKL